MPELVIERWRKRRSNDTYLLEFEETCFKAVLMCEDLMYERRNEQIQIQGNIDIMGINRAINMVVPVPHVTASSGNGFCCNNSNAPLQLAAISLLRFSGIYV